MKRVLVAALALALALPLLAACDGDGRECARGAR